MFDYLEPACEAAMDYAPMVLVILGLFVLVEVTGFLVAAIIVRRRRES